MGITQAIDKTTLHIHDSRYYTETEIDTLLSGKQDESVIVSSNQTAVNDGYYVNVATATYTDPSPVEGKGFVVFVRNGTATIGGTAYSTAGNIIYRFFHSGGWSNYVTGATNLSYTASPTQGVVVSDTGNDATIPAADGTNAGLFLPAEKTKLAGIAAGAEVNVNADWNAVSGDAQILNKPTLITDHTGLSNIGTNTHAQIDTHIGSTLNPHSVTKAQVGLDQVDNTSDLNKPVSTAVSTALGNKQNTLVSGTNIKTINNTSLLGSGDIAIFTSPEIITTPTGIIYRFTQPTKPTQRAPGVPLGVRDQWENSGDGTEWFWNGTYWVSKNVYPVSIASVYGNSSTPQVIRSDSIPSNKGLLVTELASQIAVLNANPTSTNYWTASVSLSGVSVATLSTQNATSYSHGSTTPNIVIPARSAIPVGGTLTETPLGQTSRQWHGMTTLGTDVYACLNGGDIYKQTNGTGNFVALGQTSRVWAKMTTLGTDVYASEYGGDIYKQTNGAGNFVALGQTSRLWFGMTTLGTDVYASVYGGDIYKQTNGTGNFVALGQTNRDWRGMTTLGTDIYVCVNGGDIYKQTNGTGNFVALGQTNRSWHGMTTLGTDVYAYVNGGDIYKQTNGTGNFVALGQTNRNWHGITTLGTDIYVCVNGGDIYVLTSGGVTSIGHSLEVTLNRFGSVSLPYAAIALKCREIYP